MKSDLTIYISPSEIGYFHATLPKSIPSIMNYGLLPGDFIIGQDQYQRRIILDRGVFMSFHPREAASYAASRCQESFPPYETFFWRGLSPFENAELFAILEIERDAQLDQYFLFNTAKKWSSGGGVCIFPIPPSKIKFIYLNNSFRNEYYKAVPGLRKYENKIIWSDTDEETLFEIIALFHGISVEELHKQVEKHVTMHKPRQKYPDLPPFTIHVPERGYSCIVGDFRGTYEEVIDHMKESGHQPKVKIVRLPSAFGKLVWESTSDVDCVDSPHHLIPTESGLFLCVKCNKVFIEVKEEDIAPSGTAEFFAK